MRKIRFRGVSKLENNWVFGDCMHLSANGKELAISKDNSELHPIYSASIGQITDFVDVNGEEIYEGDYVKINSEDFPDPLLVTFENGAFKIGDNAVDWFCNAPNTVNGEITGTAYFFGSKTAAGD